MTSSDNGAGYQEGIGRPVFIHSQRFLFASLLLFAGTVLLQSAVRPVIDFDEIVYLHLSERMTWTGRNYTTQGSVIAQQLPQPVYRSPVFHHPPLVPLLIKIFSTFLPSVEAARVVNALFYALLLWVVFAVTNRLCGALAGAIALGLTAICPIINLEARLIHLDLPMTTFLLLGAYLCLPTPGAPPNVARLAASGLMFAAAFLCRFTGPLFFPLPVMLFAVDRERWRRPAPTVAFFATLALGFLWWAYIVFRFGSLVPEAFHIAGIAPFTPYLRSLALRHWYDLLLYFCALCPLAVVYAADVIASGVKMVRGDIESRDRLLIVLNAATWISAVVVACLIATGSAYWTFRFFLPLVVMIYVTLGCTLSRLLGGATEWKSYLIALMLFTGFQMSWSTATSVDRGGLEAIPVALFWVGLGRLFH